MANAVIAVEASDLFSMGANFNPQSSTSNHIDDMAQALDAAGNVQCETAGLFGRTEYSVEYKYCNASPNIKSHLGDALAKFGEVKNSIVLTGLTIRFVAGEYATVTITGVQYDEYAVVASRVNYADMSAVVPTTNAGFGVPAFTGVTLGANADYASATITCSTNHVVAKGAAGNHLVCDNITFRAELSIEYVGVPTTAQPVTGWTTDTYEAGDANSEFDSYAITAHRFFDAA